MHFRLVALAALFGSISAETWTIGNFTRDCTDPSACVWKFYVDDGSEIVQCDFSGYGADTEFQNMDCFNSTVPVQPKWAIDWDVNSSDGSANMEVKRQTSYPYMIAYLGYGDEDAEMPISTYPDMTVAPQNEPGA